MNLWCAIDIDDQLVEIRKATERLTDELVIENLALSLPLHVSLRISFDIPDERKDEVLAAIKDYLSNVRSFEFETLCLELSSNIVWIRMKDNPMLSSIHDGLCQMLIDRFGVPLMPFDRCFIFHSTLAFTDNNEKASKLFQRMKDIRIPDSFMAKSFVIGISATGNPGEFRVVESGCFMGETF